ncbi:MAG: DMT family transporter [Rhodoferax sp.]|nr:DMT family transporter [Rhodoferax sp.]
MSIHILSLLFVTLVWGATFPILKIATAQLSGIETSALRFALAALCMLPWALRAPRKAWQDGVVLGGLLLISYVAQAYGLQFISSNRSAFLTSLNVLMVPFLNLAFGNPLSWRVVAAAMLACVGIGLMSWDGGAHGVADVSTILSAAAYALYVILLSARAGRHDARSLAATQIVCMAVLGWLWMLGAAQGSDRMATLHLRLNAETLWGLAYLGLIATAGMLFLQAKAQRYVSADKAALIYAMEPVFAALFAWVWLHEGLGLRAAVGAVLVVFAVVFCEWRTGRTS